MAKETKVFVAVIAVEYRGKIRYSYHSLDVKETPKRYQVLGEGPLGYKGQIIPKEFLGKDTKILGFNSEHEVILAEDDEALAKSIMGKSLEEQIRWTAKKVENLRERGLNNTAERHQADLERYQAALRLIKLHQ